MILSCLFGHKKRYKSIVRHVSIESRGKLVYEARWICGREGCHGFGAAIKTRGHWKVADNKLIPDRQKWVDGETW